MGEVTFLPPRPLRDTDDLEGFSSGAQANDSWLRSRARRAVREGTASVYVILTPDGDLAGFYSLSTHCVARTGELPGALRRNAPDPIPCTLLGQLAVDAKYQGMSVGARLLQDAIARAASAAQVVASRALVVDAVDERAAGFYRHFGFREYSGALKLFVRLPSLR